VSEQLQAALPRHHYVDPRSWHVERERVLARSWTCVGRLADLGLDGAADRLAVVEVAGESVLLTRDGAGRLHALGNVCRHRGSQVVPHLPGEPPPPSGARSLRCAYHSWAYGLDGALLRAPHTEGVEDFDPGQFGLHRAAVETWGGFAFVNLHAPDGAAGSDGGTGGLRAQLGPIVERVRRYPLERLVGLRRIVYDVAANWKVIAENYNECYHCAGVHPELTKLVPAFGRGGGGAQGTGLDWDAGIPHRDGAWTFSFSGTSPRTPFPDLDESERVRHKGELVYPNLLLSLAAEHVACFVLQPLAVDATRIVFDLLVEPEATHLDVEDCAGFWDLVNRQDWAVCESVQRGMSSSFYTQGWYAPMEDASLDIRRWLLPRLSGDGSSPADGESGRPG
jgi:Rieske 2Fe-2S family protein